MKVESRFFSVNIKYCSGWVHNVFVSYIAARKRSIDPQIDLHDRCCRAIEIITFANATITFLLGVLQFLLFFVRDLWYIPINQKSRILNLFPTLSSDPLTLVNKKTTTPLTIIDHQHVQMEILWIYLNVKFMAHFVPFNLIVLYTIKYIRSIHKTINAKITHN